MVKKQLSDTLTSIRVLDNPDSSWNDRLLSNPNGTIYQTKEYALYAKTLSWKPQYLLFENDNQIIAQLLIFKIKPKLPIQKTLYRWNYGPVLFDDKYRYEVIKQLRDYTNLKKIENKKDDGTFIIDLKLDEQTLWDNLKKNSVQNNIKRAMQKGVYIKEIDDTSLIDYYNLFQKKREKEGIKIKYKDMLFFWNTLKQVGFTGFLAYQDNIPISGILVSFFNGYVNEWGIARTELDTEQKLYSQDYLKWHIILWAKKKGFRYYDLSGINGNPITEKDKNLFRYKEKFGGQLVMFNEVFDNIKSYL